jgi:hypothetical protein
MESCCVVQDGPEPLDSSDAPASAAQVAETIGTGDWVQLFFLKKLLLIF